MRSPMIQATANDRNDHNRWDRSESISAIVAIMNNRQRSQQVNGNHQCSDRNDR